MESAGILILRTTLKQKQFQGQQSTSEEGKSVFKQLGGHGNLCLMRGFVWLWLLWSRCPLMSRSSRILARAVSFHLCWSPEPGKGPPCPVWDPVLVVTAAQRCCLSLTFPSGKRFSTFPTYPPCFIAIIH